MRMTRHTARIAACGVHMFIIGVFGTHATFAQVQPGPRLGSSAQTPAALPSARPACSPSPPWEHQQRRTPAKKGWSTSP